jgi:hypothetical protein
MTTCHICGKTLGDTEKYITVQLHDPTRKKGLEWRMTMHQGICYDKFTAGAYKLTPEYRYCLERQMAQAMRELLNDPEEMFLFFTGIGHDLEPNERGDILKAMADALETAQGVFPTAHEVLMAYKPTKS